jgi:isoquinoline 1-oxidoreductase subunit beta
MKRRTFLWATVGTVGAMAGLAVGWAAWPVRSRLHRSGGESSTAQLFEPNAWVRIGADDSITLYMPRAEMGQGTHTGLMMLLAEELDCDPAAVRLAPAPIDSVYNNLAAVVDGLPFHPGQQGLLRNATEHVVTRVVREFGVMMTGGSSSIRDLWQPLREAGAMARASLVQAAAKQWAVPVVECSVERGLIRHSSGRQSRFGEIVTAAGAELPIADEYVLKKREQFTLIGQPLPRIDSREKVSGRAVFAADVHEPDMLYAEVQFAPQRDGELQSWDDTAALGMPGVVEVAQLPPLGGAAACIAVIANQRWRARRALEQQFPQWVAGPAGRFDQALIQSTLSNALETGAEAHVYRDTGSAESTLRRAAAVVRADYEVPYLAHAAMEPLCCAVKFTGTAATVWAGVQVNDLARKTAAQALGLAAEQVTLVPTYLGGAFGRRLDNDFVAIAAALAAKVPGRLLQVQWRREDDMRQDFYRPAAAARLRASLDAQGRIEAWQQISAGQSIVAQVMPRGFGLKAVGPDKTTVEGAFDQPYDIPNLQVAHQAVELPVPVGFWRSVGHSYTAFFNECFIDELATVAQADPLAFRIAHLQQQPRHLKVLQFAAEKADWGGRAIEAADGARVARGLALHASFGSIVALVAEVSLSPEGRPRVHRIVTAIDCGQVVNPALVTQQMESAVIYGLSAALYGQITFKEGAVEQANFDTYPALRLADTPRIETWIMPNGEPPGGVGEPGVPPVAPAIANALAALTGRRNRRLPLIGA